MADQPLMELTNLRFAWPGDAHDCLDIAALRVQSGETVFLHGPSGCGKSTLLSLLAGVLLPQAGRVALLGTNWAELRPAARDRQRVDHVGYIFQQFNLVPSLSVADNLALQARLAGRHDPVWQAELIERLGLGEMLKRYPEQLSGGQQQRVAIGRALAVKPALLLADEPTGNLDEATADDVLRLTRDLVSRSGCAFLMVTHSARLAAMLDRQVHLHAGRIS